MQRQHSLAALAQPLPPVDDEEDYPPPPPGLVRATLRIRPVVGSPTYPLSAVDSPSKDGLIHRVSSLFRNSSTSSSKLGSPSSTRYKAATSTPDVRASGGAKLLKRPSARPAPTSRSTFEKDHPFPIPETPKKQHTKSLKSIKSTKSSVSSTFGFGTRSTTAKTTPASLKRERPLPGHTSTPSSGTESSEEEIRRPSGLGEASSMRSFVDEGFFEGDGPRPRPDVDEFGSTATPTAAQFSYTRSSDSHTTEEEDEIRRPSGLGSRSSFYSAVAEEETANPSPTPSTPEGYSRQRTRSSPASTFAHLHNMLGLAPPVPRPSLVARSIPAPVWRVVTSHLSLADAARCARVNRPFCDGTRERLYAVVDLRKLRPRLLDALRLPHIAALVQAVVVSGWSGPISELRTLPSVKSVTVFPARTTSPVDFQPLVRFLRAHHSIVRLAIVGDTPNDEGLEKFIRGNSPFLPNLTHLHASPAIACLLLERLATAPTPVPTPTPTPTSEQLSVFATPGLAESRFSRILSNEALSLLAPDAPPKPRRSVRENRIPRKPVPSHFFDVSSEPITPPDDTVQLKRAVSVNLGLVPAPRAVFMTAPNILEQHSIINPVLTPHPLRVLRIAMPRPLYDGAGTVGGGRIGKAIASVLMRGDAKKELALHVMIGPRVDKRTMEKMLRTIGTGVSEGLAKNPSSVALLEVRSKVRMLDLYKTMSTVLPRYPTLRTLLLTRPGRQQELIPSNPPSPISPTLYFPSPPATPGFPPPGHFLPPPSPALSIHPPPSPVFGAQYIPLPPSPAQSPSPTKSSSPTSTLTPPITDRRASIALLPPGLLIPPSPSHSTFSRRSASQQPPAWAWEWDGWGDAGDVLATDWDDELELDHERLPDVEPEPYSPFIDGSFADEDGDADVLSREDALRVGAWRRHCTALERVRMVSGAWWFKDASVSDSRD
ncbi:hypothetical protein MKEN_01267300 [Mycena kentingensis (nom. inval.)]|nr:hypothetical protein MKEN_01267300 [Mycena kentingensis (nom. inval.)]